MENVVVSFLKSVRKNRGLTQKKFSEEVNYSEPSIKKYESGRRRPTIKFLLSLQTIFSLTSEEENFLEFIIKKLQEKDGDSNDKNLSLEQRELEILKKERELESKEKKIKKQKLELEKEKVIFMLDAYKSDYSKILETITSLKKYISELDEKTSFNLKIKEISRKELCIMLENSVRDLDNIKKRIENKYVEELEYEY